jgi:hypothetical protein
MAARRLLIVMVVLLVLSSVAAALVPPPPESTTTSESTTTAEGRQSTKRRSGEFISERVSADSGPPSRIRLKTGDQLSLTVTSKAFQQIAVRGLGLLEPAEPGAPARFDVFVDRPGSFPVQALGGGGPVARLNVHEPGRPGGQR